MVRASLSLRQCPGLGGPISPGCVHDEVHYTQTLAGSRHELGPVAGVTSRAVGGMTSRAVGNMTSRAWRGMTSRAVHGMTSNGPWYIQSGYSHHLLLLFLLLLQFFPPVEIQEPAR